MNTKSQNNLKSQFLELLKYENTKEEIKDDAQMLMFAFISEINKHRDMQGVTKKTLANRIKTSASYLTQIFRGDKPLNFVSIAKMQRALAINFQIKAFPNSCEVRIEDETYFLDSIKKFNVKGGFWSYHNTSLKRDRKEIYENGIDVDLIIDNQVEYDKQAIPA
jgi:hypothetical protein